MIVKKAIALGGMLLLGIAAGPARAEVDSEAAQTLAKKNDCFKCHAIDKTKKAPPYNRIAGRLKTKPDAVEVRVEHITSGPMIEFQDGTSDRHKIIDTTDPRELRNLAEWILSL